jgi:hypothetical protein
MIEHSHHCKKFASVPASPLRSDFAPYLEAFTVSAPGFFENEQRLQRDSAAAAVDS